MSHSRFEVQHDHNFPRFFDIDDILKEPDTEPIIARVILFTYEELIKKDCCPKCGEKNRIEITKTIWHCPCGLIAYRAWEEKPVTLEMIQRPEPTNVRSI